MGTLNFKDLMEKNGRPAPARSEDARQQNGLLNASYKEAALKSRELDGAVAEYKKAYLEKKKREAFLKEIADECDALKMKLVEMTGYKGIDNESCSLSQKTRKGNVDWKQVQKAHPEIEIDDYRKESTSYWTMLLKVTE